MTDGTITGQIDQNTKYEVKIFTSKDSPSYKKSQEEAKKIENQPE